MTELQQATNPTDALRAALPEIIQRLNVTWDGELGNGALSLTAMVRLVDKTPAVLKLDADHERLARQVTAQRAWATTGLAPNVLHTEPGLCLMERVTDVIHPTLDPSCLTAQVRALIDGWAVAVPETLEPGTFWWTFEICRQRLEATGTNPLSPRVFDTAHALVQQLRKNRPVGLCHGDPTRENLLVDTSAHGWLIDPLPHTDSLICVLAHWGCRVENGQNGYL